MDLKDINITFEVLSTDKTTNTAVIRPWCDKFLYPLSSYPALNLSLAHIDQTQDINVQIAKLCGSYVLDTLQKESSTHDLLISSIDALKGSTINVPFSAISNASTINQANTATNITESEVSQARPTTPPVAKVDRTIMSALSSITFIV